MIFWQDKHDGRDQTKEQMQQQFRIEMTNHTNEESGKRGRWITRYYRLLCGRHPAWG